MLMVTSSSLPQGMSLQILIIASNVCQLVDRQLSRMEPVGPTVSMVFVVIHTARHVQGIMRPEESTMAMAFHRLPLHLEMLLIWKLSSQHTIKENLTLEFAKSMESQRKTKQIS
jgi:hypothetical protein